MTSVQESIDVEVPISTAYNQWTQFEEFPRFMEGVEEVRQIDDTHLRWKTKIAGRTKEWTAEIVEQRPDERVAWKDTAGTHNAGVVLFSPTDPTHTRITAEIEAETEGIVEAAGDALGFVKRRVKGDLERFKEFIEHRGEETGSWRGEVRNGAKESGAQGMGQAGSGAMGSEGSGMGTSGTGSAGGSYSSPEGSGSGTNGIGGEQGGPGMKDLPRTPGGPLEGGDVGS